MCVQGIAHRQKQYPDTSFTFPLEHLVGWQGRCNPTERNHPILFAKRPYSNPLAVRSHTESFAAVSPARQRAAKNLFRGYLFNGYRRLSSQVGYWIVPVVIGTFQSLGPSVCQQPTPAGYSTYAWAKKHDAYLNSKEGHLAHSGEH